MKVLNYLAVFIFVVLAFYLLYIGKDLLLPLIAIALWYLIFYLINAFARVSVGQFQFPSQCVLWRLSLLLWFNLVGNQFLSSTVDDVLEIAPVYQQNLNARLNLACLFDISEFEGQVLVNYIDWIDITPAYARSIASSLTSILAVGGVF